MKQKNIFNEYKEPEKEYVKYRHTVYKLHYSITCFPVAMDHNIIHDPIFISITQ